MIAAALVALLAQGARDVVRASVIELPAGEEFAAALYAEVDGDGRPDLVTIAVPADAARAGAPRRRISIRLARAGAPRFAAAPDHELALTPDVVAFAIGDVHPDAGREVVLWAARGAVAWRPREADERARFVKLLEADVLWQLGADDDVLAWRPGAADLDGDGLDDLLTPTLDGYAIHRQRRADGRAQFEPWVELPVRERVREELDRADVRTADEDADAGGGSRSFSLSFGGGARIEPLAPRELVSIEERLPAPILADWDGDGVRDCLAQTATELLVFRLGKGARAGALEPLRLALPVELDLGRRLDVSYAAAAADVDGDGRVDCAIFAGDKRASDVRTQVLVFTQAGAPEGEAPLFGDRGRPSQLLVLAGFAGAPRIEDVDGDGRLDLAVASVRPDLLDALGGGDAFEAELDVFLGGGAGFSRKPDLAARVRVDADAIGRGAAARFLDDAGGDGVRDLLVRERDRLALHLVRRRKGGGLELLPKPVWTGPIDPEALLTVERGAGDAPPVAIVRERGRLRVLEVAR